MQGMKLKMENKSRKKKKQIQIKLWKLVVFIAIIIAGIALLSNKNDKNVF